MMTRATPGTDPGTPWVQHERYPHSAPVVQASAEPEGVDILHGKRAGDTERDRVIRHLSQCHARGYLPEDLWRARMAQASQAATKQQLNALLADLDALPEPEPSLRERVARSPGRRRTLHAAFTVSALMWAIPGNVFIWSQVGRADDGIEALFWLSIVLSVCVTIISIVAWCVWEDHEDD